MFLLDYKVCRQSTTDGKQTLSDLNRKPKTRTYTHVMFKAYKNYEVVQLMSWYY